MREINRAEFARLLDFYGPVLTERQADVAQQFFENDLSLSEIADNTAVSRQAVHHAIHASCRKLREMEAALGLVDRFTQMHELVATLSSLVDDIQLNNELGQERCTEIRTLLEQIETLL